MPETEIIQSLTADSIIADTLVKDTALITKPTVEFAGFEGIPFAKTIASEPIVPILLLSLFLLTVYTFIKGQKIIKETINDFFYLRLRSSIFIESLSGQTFLQNNFGLLFIGSAGLFLHIIFFDKTDLIGNFENRMLYLALFVGLALAFIVVKVLVFRFLGYVFFDKSITSAFTRGYFTALFSLGVILFLIDTALIYAPSSFYYPLMFTGLIAITITLILIFYKTSQIFLTGIDSFFYIILYLCTLEILPALVMLKIIS
jgi:hypothetical protein